MQRSDEQFGVGVELARHGVEEEADDSDWDKRARYSVHADLDGGEEGFAPPHPTPLHGDQQHQVLEVVVLNAQLDEPTSKERRQLVVQDVGPGILVIHGTKRQNE